MIRQHIESLLAMPLLCGLYVLYFNLAFQKDSAVQAPEKLYHERTLMAYVVLLIVVFAILTVVRIPALHVLMEAVLIPV